MLVSELQSWGKCAACGVSIWVEPSAHEQRCACACGSCALHDDARLPSDDWADLTEAEFQPIVDAEP